MRWILVCFQMALACMARGQEFEVVSVKPNKTMSNSSHTHSDPGMLMSTNVTLKSLIATAYGMKEYQVEGPDWLTSEHFDITAKFSEALPNNREKYSAAMAAMTQKMLVDRFKLAVHRDRKPFTVYGLVAAKGGIKFKPGPDCDPHSESSHSNNNHYEGTCIRMATFAGFLARRVDLPVLDMTELTGAYNLTFDWKPEARQSSETKSDAPGGADLPTGLTFAETVQAQLGLKLDLRKVPIEILVVDHAERAPTEN